MECRVSQILDYGRRSIVIGEVVRMYVRDECLDASGRYVLPEVYQPIARVHANNYIVADNQFVLTKPDDFVHHDIAAGYGGPVPEAKGRSENPASRLGPADRTSMERPSGLNAPAYRSADL